MRIRPAAGQRRRDLADQRDRVRPVVLGGHQHRPILTKRATVELVTYGLQAAASRLEETGVVRCDRAQLDLAAVGRGLWVFAGIRLLRTTAPTRLPLNAPSPKRPRSHTHHVQVEVADLPTYEDFQGQPPGQRAWRGLGDQLRHHVDSHLVSRPPTIVRTGEVAVAKRDMTMIPSTPPLADGARPGQGRGMTRTPDELVAEFWASPDLEKLSGYFSDACRQPSS
jgi:hypothetical protein